MRLEPPPTGRRSSSARISTPCRRPGRSSRSSRTASCATRAGRSSAPTTSRRSSRCSRASRRVLAEGRPHAGIELIFTPKEEVGLIGDRGLRPRPAARATSATSTTRPRRSARSSSARRTPQAMQVTFHGRAAHSGMFPEEGRSAIQAAAKAIADLRLGRVDEETTANVGTISGGTAGNIVPEWCSFLAEARCHDETTAERARAGDARRRSRSRRRRATARSRRRRGRTTAAIASSRTTTSSCSRPLR